MQKSILASAILISLTACDSNSLTAVPADNNVAITAETPIAVTADIGEDSTNTDAGEDSTNTNVSEDTTSTVVANDSATEDDDKYDDEENVTVVANNGGKNDDKPVANNNDKPVEISDDAGSSTSDGGQTASNNDTAGNNNSDNAPMISDDAGSSTSDGGQISDDAGSSSSDGGQISDDAGSSSSDGGQNNDDAGNSSSDGGVANNAAGGSSTGSQGARETNAGTFASDGTTGNVIRVSSLTANSTENICTSLSNQNNFSDTRVGDFILHNNAWRPFRAFPGFEWEQCITTNTNGSIVGWNYDWGPGQTGVNGASAPSGDFFVRSYPELIYGTKDEFRTSGPTSETGLPVRLTEMPTFRIDYSYDGPQFGEPRTVDASNNPRFPNGTTISGERNVAVESFFYEPNAAGNCTTDIVSRSGGSNHAYEVMVWIDAGAERLPAGPNDFVADLNIRGDDYKVYTKDSDERYIAFVAQNPQTTGTIYMNDYIDWARENAHLVRERFGARSNSVQIQDRWCMANILVGTEIFWGAGSLNIFDWTITQSR